MRSGQASFYMARFGPCDEHSLLLKSAPYPGRSFRISAAGAVCDCLGKFFNAEGKVARTDVNQRTLSVQLDHLFEKRNDSSLCVGREL